MATFAGVMSACFAFGLTAGNPISETSRLAGTSPIWTGLPKLVVVFLGGFTTNFVWCVYLNLRNRSGHEYFARHLRPAADAAFGLDRADRTVPVLANYLFSALAGVTWYFQFFFYSMGETQMGRFGFDSWTLHMASIIIFSTVWGWYFREWRGSSRVSHGLISAGIAALILSTVVIGYGTYIKGAN